jgi:hypothetical protein
MQKGKAPAYRVWEKIHGRAMQIALDRAMALQRGLPWEFLSRSPREDRTDAGKNCRHTPRLGESILKKRGMPHLDSPELICLAECVAIRMVNAVQ